MGCFEQNWTIIWKISDDEATISFIKLRNKTDNELYFKK